MVRPKALSSLLVPSRELSGRVAGVTQPAGLAAGGQVIESLLRGIAQGLADGVGRHVGDQLGAGGGAHLVVDHLKGVTLAHQPGHGGQEVAAAGGIDPTGAKYQVPTATVLDTAFTGELAGPVVIHRPGRVGLLPGSIAAAVEHVIGGVVHQQGAQRLDYLCQHAGGVSVDTAGQVVLFLGAVYGNVGGRIDDQLQPCALRNNEPSHFSYHPQGDELGEIAN